MIRLILKAKVPKISFHTLRHTHATIMLANGENVKVVSERLGHARPAITLNFYAHVMPNMQDQAAENFETSLKPKIK